MNADRVFIDTNVLVYLFDESEPAKQKRAEQRLLDESREIFVSTQVLQELYVALTKGGDPIATPAIAERAVRDAAGYSVVQVDIPLVLSAIEATREHGLSFWDALIVRAAAQADCGTLLSEDLNAGQVIAGVRVENPFVELDEG
jgi:predicted nucleic acid-binding protein